MKKVRKVTSLFATPIGGIAAFTLQPRPGPLKVPLLFSIFLEGTSTQLHMFDTNVVNPLYIYFKKKQASSWNTNLVTDNHGWTLSFTSSTCIISLYSGMSNRPVLTLKKQCQSVPWLPCNIVTIMTSSPESTLFVISSSYILFL